MSSRNSTLSELKIEEDTDKSTKKESKFKKVEISN